MEKRPVSMRQIAKECGCSVATVSYALNRSSQAKISSATRLRIIETAKRLNYSPSRMGTLRPARALILIGACPGDTANRRTVLLDLAWHLGQCLREQEMVGLTLEVSDLSAQWAQIQSLQPDLLFMLDYNSQAVSQLDPPCVQPIIFLDSNESDPLYYKVLPDYPSLLRLAAQRLDTQQLFLASESPLPRQLLPGLAPEDCFFRGSGQSLSRFLASHRGRRGLVIGDLLAVEACTQFPAADLAVLAALERPALFPPELTVLSLPNRVRAAAAARTAWSLLSLDYDSEGSTLLLLEAEG